MLTVEGNVAIARAKPFASEGEDTICEGRGEGLEGVALWIA